MKDERKLGGKNHEEKIDYFVLGFWVIAGLFCAGCFYGLVYLIF